MATPPLPAGYVLDSGTPPLPPGYKLDSAEPSQSQPDPKLVDALHKAYDSRPLWRKVLGLNPDPDSLAPEVRQFMQQSQKDLLQHFGPQMADALQNHLSGMKEGAIGAAKMAPFMLLGPAGGAVDAAVGGGVTGTLANMAAQGTGAAAISKLEGASNAGAAVAGGLGAAGSVVGKALDSVAGSGVAQRLYQSALKPSTRIPPEKVAKVVETGLQEGIPVSRNGLDKLSGLIDDVNDKIQATIDAAPNRPINKFAVTARLGDTAKRFSNQVNPNADLAAIGDAGNEFLANQPGAIAASDAQAMKQGTYQQLKGKAYGELKSASIEAQKALARGLKEELAQQFPELNDLNAKDSAFYNLQGVLEKAVQRISNHQMIGIGTPLAAAAGKAVTGSNAVAGVTGVMKAVLDDPLVKSRLAIVLSRTGLALPQITSRVAAFSNALAQSAVTSSSRPPDDQQGGTSQ